MGRQFSEFRAAELFCPKCNECLPVCEQRLTDTREETIELRCARCGTIVGRHTVTDNSLGGRLARAWNQLRGK